MTSTIDMAEKHESILPQFNHFLQVPIDAKSQQSLSPNGRSPTSTDRAPPTPVHSLISAISTMGTVNKESESGRSWMTRKFFPICWKSSCTASKWVNLLWPFVPAAMVMFFVFDEAGTHSEWIFALAYISMIPTANLLGFAGQELSRKIPLKGVAVVVETLLGSTVEIIILITLLIKQRGIGDDGVTVIRAAILGSILANMLLCLGLCFIFGGGDKSEGEFHDAVSDTGITLMTVAGMALAIPTAWSASANGRLSAADLNIEITKISRGSAFILLAAFAVYLVFQIRTHHDLFDEILKGEEVDRRGRRIDHTKEKLTFTECIVAIIIAMATVALMAYFLVSEIEPLVHQHRIKDAFIGLILIPLVEKLAEHLTAIDEAKDNQMNLALAHVLGSCIQTALLNTPIVILIGWCVGTELSINFEVFDSVALILTILVVGSFLRDGKSNYLEGSLSCLVYVLIALCAYFYPDPINVVGTASEGGH